MSLRDSKQVLQRTAGMNRGGRGQKVAKTICNEGILGLRRQITFFFLFSIRLFPPPSLPKVKDRRTPRTKPRRRRLISSSVLQRPQSSLEVIRRKELRRQSASGSSAIKMGKRDGVHWICRRGRGRCALAGHAPSLGGLGRAFKFLSHQVRS